jgi:hypothetical protein
MPSKKSIIFIALFLVLWTLFTWFIFRMPQTTAPVVQNQTSTPATGIPAVSSSTGVLKTGIVSSKQGAPASGGGQSSSGSATGANYVVAPAANAQWVFAQTNVIQWKRDTGVTGYVYLANAADGSVAGWLIQQTNSHDTSFSWNTRDLYVSRTSSIKKDVQPGRYIIKIVFNSPRWAPIASGAFSIILPSQVQVPMDSFAIQNGLFSPGSLSVKRGTRLVFTNKDSIPYQIIISSFGVPFTLEPGGSYTFDTSPLSPGGTYVFYSASSTLLRASVVIQ